MCIYMRACMHIFFTQVLCEYFINSLFYTLCVPLRKVVRPVLYILLNIELTLLMLRDRFQANLKGVVSGNNNNNNIKKNFF